MKSENAGPINAILSDFKNGDERALKKLQDLYREALISYAYLKLGDTGDAEDVVQEVFLKLWTRRANLKPDTRIDRYLFAAVHNNCVSVWRKKKNSHKVKGMELAGGLAYSYNASSLENKELNRDLWAAIASLPPAERKYFRSAYVDGENHKQIADRHNVSVQVVKNAISNALKKLREILKEIKD